MIFFKIANANIFPVTAARTVRHLAACSAIVRFMHWVINAAAISHIHRPVSRIVPLAYAHISARIMQQSVKN